MIRKDVIIAVVAIFCLTASLFMVATSKSQTGSEYDPWADYNADGIIDIFDIVPVALTFGTAGDSTKNVTIAGRASKLITLARAQQVDGGTYFTSDVISVEGYSKISISITFTEPEFDYYLWTGHDPSNMLFLADQLDETALGHLNCKTYDVMNTYIKIRVRNTGLYFGFLDLDVYLIP